MGVIILILVVIAALLAVISGVWVALALINAINLKQKRIIDTDTVSPNKNRIS